VNKTGGGLTPPPVLFVASVPVASGTSATGQPLLRSDVAFEYRAFVVVFGHVTNHDDCHFFQFFFKNTQAKREFAPYI
jgi:hypothetical protein